MSDSLAGNVVEQGDFSEKNISSLGIVDPSRPYGTLDIHDCFNTINGWGCAFMYTIVDFGEKYYQLPETKPWCNWQHIGNHVEEGKPLWNFMWQNDFVKDFVLHDSPDFSGEFTNGKRLIGDIGKVSAMAFMFSVLSMEKGDLWITVNGSRHTMLEAQFNVGREIMENHSQFLAKSGFFEGVLK